MARPRQFDPLVVLDAAIKVFWRYGFAGASIGLLTEAMGLGRASIYAAFEDKHTLYLQSLSRYHATVIKRVLEPLFETDLPGLEAVTKSFDAQRLRLCDHANPPGCFAVLAGQEVDADHPEVTRILEDVLSDFELGFYQALRRAQIERSLPVEHDPKELGRSLAYVMYGMASASRVRRDPRALEEVQRTWLTQLRD